MGLDLHEVGGHRTHGLYTSKNKVSTTSLFHAMPYKVTSV
jgi:hypothetical protein